MWRGAASLLALLFAGSAADTNQCFTPNGTKANCGPAAQQCGPNFANAPAFHVMDASCAENDPNGPVYDHKHGMYHLFYQDHLAEVPGHGPVYGHAVSRDLAHWARLPVAIWNDQPYDNEAIYTGSATVVDGNIIQVYPGLCNSHDWASCGTGTNLAVAVPADPSDPLLTNWTKPDYNPIINGSQRDPSTAWKTPDGEWRLTTYDTVVYGSMDFKTWYKIGEQPGFPTGECPSFFELPRATPGSQPHPTAETPTHVHKCSHGGKDWMQVGSYTPNGPHLAGTWTATPGVSFAESIIDVGSYYASKDFYDPVKKRRINWGWAQVPPASTQSLPREVTWDAQLQQLVFSPLEEQATLRGDALAAMGKTHLHPGSLPVKLAKSDAAGQSETQGACNLGVRLTTSSPTSALFNIDFIPNANTSSPTWEVNVGAETKTTAHVMQSYDLPGDDYNVTNVDYTDFATCEAACNGDAKCVAWTYVVRPPLHASCCLKSSVPSPVKWSKGSIVSGVKNPQPTETSAPLRLGAGDTTLTMSLYVDNTFTEAYWQGGRVAMTLPTPVASGAGLEIVSGCDATLESLDTWEVKSIWVDPEEVCRTRDTAHTGCRFSAPHAWTEKCDAPNTQGIKFQRLSHVFVIHLPPHP